MQRQRAVVQHGIGVLPQPVTQTSHADATAQINLLGQMQVSENETVHLGVPLPIFVGKILQPGERAWL